MEETRAYVPASEIADEVYRLVASWPTLAQQTFGRQLVNSADSIGANRVEGDARRSDAESTRFFLYSRSSARETRHWIVRARVRAVLSNRDAEELSNRVTDCGKMISGIIDFRREAIANQRVREDRASYGVRDDDDYLVSSLPKRPNDRVTE